MQCAWICQTCKLYDVVCQDSKHRPVGCMALYTALCCPPIVWSPSVQMPAILLRWNTRILKYTISTILIASTCDLASTFTTSTTTFPICRIHCIYVCIYTCIYIQCTRIVIKFHKIHKSLRMLTPTSWWSSKWNPLPPGCESVLTLQAAELAALLLPPHRERHLPT